MLRLNSMMCLRDAQRCTYSTTSLSGASVDWDRILLVIVGFTSKSERYPGVPVRRALKG